MKTIVLFSAGLDSTTVLAKSIARGDQVLALVIDYGQTNQLEIKKCEILASMWGFPYKTIKVPLEVTDPRKEVPARNTIFLAKALECALLEKADCVAFGAEPEDVYTDSSPKFVAAMREVFALHNVKLVAPLQEGLKDKTEVLRAALELGVPLDILHSSRTNYVNGGCKTSMRFLLALQDVCPAFHPVDLLQTIHDTHRDNSNPFNISKPYEEFIEWMAPQTNWAIKQAMSRVPRPQYLPCGLCIEDNEGQFIEAAKSLGYKLDPENGMPLIVK